MIKQLPFTLFFLLAFKITAQESRKMLYATIIDDLGTIPEAHIINLNTKQGTFSNDNGEFRILAKLNDSLQISFVGFETKIITVESTHFGITENRIKLTKTTIELDEVEVKKHTLIGSIAIDTKQTPKDIGIEKSKKAVDFSNIDFSQPVISNIDIIDRGKAPNARKFTDPTANFAGVGGGVSLGTDKYSENLRKLRKEINYKESFPDKLLSEFGSHFFFEELKIPKDKYLHFLEFCNFRNIENLYKEEKVLKVIDILQEESIKYLSAIHQEK